MPIAALQCAPFTGGGFFYPKSGKSRKIQEIFKNPALPAALARHASSTLQRALSLALAAWLGFSPTPACAVSMPLSEKHFQNAQEKPATPASPEAAAEAISGSRYPGVLDHLLILPADPEENPSSLQVHINYPSTGQKDIDGDIRNWVSNLADIFARHLEVSGLGESLSAPPEESAIFLQDNDLLSAAPEKKNFELWGDYTITRPSDMAISVTFEIWNYAGNPQGNLDIMTLNYNLANGRRLELADIFENPGEALLLMSNFSRKQLEGRFGPAGRGEMLREGTAPLAENFSSLTLTKNGISINFQPWQVAPWEAGIQRVEIPLAELLAAGPLLALWNQ